MLQLRGIVTHRNWDGETTVKSAPPSPSFLTHQETRASRQAATRIQSLDSRRRRQAAASVVSHVLVRNLAFSVIGTDLNNRSAGALSALSGGIPLNEDSAICLVVFDSSHTSSGRHRAPAAGNLKSVTEEAVASSCGIDQNVVSRIRFILQTESLDSHRERATRSGRGSANYICCADGKD
jgi:hypothetical protein